MTSIQRDVFKCVLSGDLESIKEHFERNESQEMDPCGMKDEAGRNALLTACMLGRTAIVRELVGHGARVDEQTVRGYSSLHLAACWGHLETVRTLLDLGADTQAKTFRGERPVDLARTYSRTDCADCLILAEAKQDLTSYVDFVKDLVSDTGRSLTKHEKDLVKSLHPPAAMRPEEKRPVTIMHTEVLLEIHSRNRTSETHRDQHSADGQSTP